MQGETWQSLGNPTKSGSLFQVYPTYLVLFSRIYTKLPGTEVLRSVPNPLEHEFAPDGFDHVLLSTILLERDVDAEASFRSMYDKLKPGHNVEVTTSADVAAWMWSAHNRLGLAMRLSDTTEVVSDGLIKIPCQSDRKAFTLHVRPSTLAPFEVVDLGEPQGNAG